ncbi:class I SAM-dependent methyltransferase [Labrys sp. ZIDIC5]|uniref:class I SAM-dependent methyltransferase n=1 Tax=Labrys sedimenti TaxID=3106036 RepID=UPI002ACAD427|nr:class I SAM-dependent methyltransferase [Labrys sp. ZIDIC5]MDZ5450927.1 class I SAM-dependent methyltransferase [Labrys sp. ZIDIC5]
MTESRILFDKESLITPELFSEAVAVEQQDFNAAEYESAVKTVTQQLNRTNLLFQQGHEPQALIHETAHDLHILRRKLSRGSWQALIPVVQSHPVAVFFLQDPFTRWSYTKPRGYSGDAGLLDFIYEHASVADLVAGATPIGRQLHAYTRNASSSVAVRERRDLLTRQIDDITLARGGGTEILAIAAGHLREADRSIALRDGGISRWMALDQDPLSVASIGRDFAATSIVAIEGTVRGLLTDATGLGSFDFIYAAGLYDYLNHRVAVKLTRRCLSLLKPNGIFLFANFAREIGVDGYMETFMNWPLLLRTEGEMRSIVDASIQGSDMHATVHFGENRNIVYALIHRA